MAWPEDLTKLLKRISLPAEEVFKGLRVLGDYNKENIDALKTAKGTEFAIYVDATDLSLLGTTPEDLTGVATGDLILKSVSLQTAAITEGTNVGITLGSDDASYPLVKDLASAALAADTHYSVDLLDYKVASGQKVQAKSITAAVTSGAGYFVLVFMRMTDGATISGAVIS